MELSLTDRVIAHLDVGKPKPRELWELDLMELYHCDPLTLDRIPVVRTLRYMAALRGVREAMKPPEERGQPNTENPFDGR